MLMVEPRNMHLIVLASVLAVGLCQLGGWTDQDKTDPQYLKLLDRVLQYQLPNGYTLKAVQTQVVAGVNIKFVLENANGGECEIVVFEQSWTNTERVTHDTCKASRNARAGSYLEQPLGDPRWSTLLASLEVDYHLIAMPANSSVKIDKVETQIVAGENYRFTLNVGGKDCTLVYFEQTWTDTREITSDTCGIKVTKKRQIPGGAMPQDPTDPKWAILLNEIETKYNLTDLSAANSVNIVAVSTQVVAGIITHFTLNVDGTLCFVDYFSQTWTGTHQVTKDTCKTTTTTMPLAGGWTSQDPSDQKWADMLQTLDHHRLVDLSGANGLEILGVQTQVVAGVNYKFHLKVNDKPCDLTYFEQAWTNTRLITHDTCGIKVNHRRAQAQTCHLADGLNANHGVPMPGGWAAQDPSDQQWADLLQTLDRHRLVDLGGANGLEILGVQTQVVAGMNYGFTLRVNGHKCELVYFEQSWTHTEQITCDTCGIKVNHKRQLVGGNHYLDATDPKWAALLQQLDTQYHLVDLSAVNGLEVLGVQEQVVAGVNYKFHLKVNDKTCDLTYYEQVWTNTRLITHDTCGLKVTHRRAQSQTCHLADGLHANGGVPMPGGWAAQDPSDQQWADLLQKLYHHHLVDLSGANGLEILGVQRQTVAGYNTGFTLRVNGHKCELVYFEQSWTHTEQITCDTCGIAVNHKRQLLGGDNHLDGPDPKWTALLQQLDTQYHLLDLGAANGLEVLGVQQQVVSGLNYKFHLKVNGKVCDLVYYEQLWTGIRRITYDTCGLQRTHKRNIDTSAAQQQCMGAILDRINFMSNSLFRLVDNRIMQAQTESNGNEVRYGVTVQVTESNCINNQESMGKMSTDCPVSQNSNLHSVWQANCRYSNTNMPIEVTDLNMINH